MRKTITFTAIHFVIAFTVAWLLTGDWLVGGLIALVEPTVNSVAYFFHEKAWNRFAPTAGALKRDTLGTPAPI